MNVNPKRSSLDAANGILFSLRGPVVPPRVVIFHALGFFLYP